MIRLIRKAHKLLKMVRDSERLWRAGMFCVVFFFVLTAIEIVIRFSDLGKEAKDVSRTHFSLNLLADLLSAVKDEEIGQRGFIITHDEKFLQPKLKADKDIPDILDKLKRFAWEDSDQLTELNNLENLIQRRVAEIDRVFKVGKDESTEAASEIMKAGVGKALMDEIRSDLIDMESHESRILRDRLDAFEKTRLQGKYVWGGTALAILLLTLVTICLDALFQKNREAAARESSYRKKVEEELVHSQNRLRAAIGHLPLRLYSVDQDLRYTWLYDSNNPVNSKEIIGKRDDELFDSNDVSELIALQKQVLSSGIMVRRTLKLPFFGKNAFYDVTIDPDLTKSNQIFGLTISAFDIQHQINLQLALEGQARDLRAIADTMPQLVWATDAEGVPNYYNKRWYEYASGSPEINYQLEARDFAHPDDYAEVHEKWIECVKTGAAFESEIRLRNGVSGEYRWFVARALPIRDERGLITRWFGTFTDVHDQKMIANSREDFLAGERAARKQVEHVMASKEAYVSILTHELRGPINTIIGWTQLIRSKKGAPDISLINRAIDIIEKNARSQAQLISDLFEMQGINAGKIALEIANINLSQIVEAAADNVLPACQQKNISLLKNIEQNICDVSGEGRRITQVLMNLLNNSLKFTGSGGTITISLKRVANDCVIEVQDTGIGIEASALPLIFDRYNQGISEGAKGQGLGLGLAIARSLVKLHGGRIEVFSEGKGKGSTFRVNLPCRTNSDTNDKNNEESVSPSIPPGSLLDNFHILLVEDQEDSREALARILSGQGAKVDAVASAYAALDLMDKIIPQTIISDISMPEMDGYMLMKEVIKRHGRIPAIALTAFSRQEDKAKAFEAGFTKHIGKPPDTALLIDAIRNISNGIKS